MAALVGGNHMGSILASWAEAGMGAAQHLKRGPL